VIKRGSVIIEDVQKFLQENELLEGAAFLVAIAKSVVHRMSGG
jgi:hypothetical protein